VTILGFPGVGGMGSRVSVSLTRGVISGYDTTEAGFVFKTDAEIGSGNSGGAALDAAYRLIGVPTGTVEDAEGYSQLGYILPISRLPAEWKAKIEP
jgi:S1-C subfamily serine protease